MIDYSKLYRMIPDKIYLELLFKRRLGKNLNLKNPTTFSEKIQWLKLYDRKPIYTKMVDKYETKRYVADVIGEQYIVPTYGVWERFDDIDFNLLPNRFVLKCTHDSGGVVIVRDKDTTDITRIRKIINEHLSTNYFYARREWPYKNVKRAIIAEELLGPDKNEDIIDYKFFCFHGDPTYCQVICDRSTHETIDFYDMKWDLQEFTGLHRPIDHPYPHAQKKIEEPKTFELMKEYSAKLSGGIPFVRVDYYEIEGKLYFGELTFYPASGFGEFYPNKWNDILGDMIHTDRVGDI